MANKAVQLSAFSLTTPPLAYASEVIMQVSLRLSLGRKVAAQKPALSFAFPLTVQAFGEIADSGTIMADPLSTTSGVLSLVDIAFRTCKGLRSLIDDLKGAPRKVEHLRREKQSWDSVLHNLRLFIAEFESSSSCHQILLAAVKDSIAEIQNDSKSLDDLLAQLGSEKSIQGRLKYIWKSSRFAEIDSNLDSQHRVLSLALQSESQYVCSRYSRISPECLLYNGTRRTGVKLYDDISKLRIDFVAGQNDLMAVFSDSSQENRSSLQAMATQMRTIHEQ